MVEVRHGAGTFVVAESSALMTSAMTAVVKLENIDLLSILDLSETLYLQAARLAVDAASDEEIAGLREAAGRFESAADDEAFATSLEAFLKTLVAMSHNKLLEAVAAYLIETQIGLARDVATRVPSVWKKIAGPLAKERLAIADALASRDRGLLDEAVRTYMGRGRELVARNAGGTFGPRVIKTP
jgi:GntR family transcriptional repressor for pyruvate dehydrogenase complex